MKKIGILFMLVLIILLTGCETKDKQTKDGVITIGTKQ